MTKQTHTVATDALATLGTIIDETAGRDAIHLAVEPIEAGETLFPGQNIGIRDGKAFAAGDPVKALGIVDPFLTVSRVVPGQRFWLVVYPRKITSLRHVWEHPEIPSRGVGPSPMIMNAEAYIRDLAESVDLSYGRLLEAAKDWVRHKDYITGGSEMEGEHVPEEFWIHYEAVTGEKVSSNDRGSFFSCSC